MSALRTLGSLVLAGALALGASQPLAAQPAAPRPLAETLTGQPKSDYEAGRILFNDGDTAGALVKFQRAFEESGDIRLLWNVAVCEKNLRHYANVLRLLTRYRDEGRRVIAPEQASQVEEILQTVRLLISTVHLYVSQDGATVFVDNTEIGKTPLTEPLLLDLGTRRIRLEKAGYRSHEVTQDFTGNSEVSIHVDMQREVSEGRLSITSEANATITIDGQIVGQGSFQGLLQAGEHLVMVTAPDMRPYSRELVIVAGQARALSVSLAPKDAGSGTTWLWVAGGVLVAGGIATGAYFLLKPSAAPQPVVGSWSPGTIQLP
jgi:hypothetical protein